MNPNCPFCNSIYHLWDECQYEQVVIGHKFVPEQVTPAYWRPITELRLKEGNDENL